MAQVNIEGVIDHLDTEMRNALELTIKQHFPDQNISKWELFRTFKRMVSRKCSTWENVPDNLVIKSDG